MTKTNKMNTIVTMNWRIKDLIREKLSFQKWHKTVFGVDASRKVLSKIKAEAKELVEMKEAMLLAARGEAAA
tara:strand:- start:132 stop:347 length:216 start_codon:yes stop_codon:yes gene_type:complete